MVDPHSMTMTKPSTGGNFWTKSSNADDDGWPTRSMATGARSAHRGARNCEMYLVVLASLSVRMDATTRVRCTTVNRRMSVLCGKYSCFTSTPVSDTDWMDCSVVPPGLEKADVRMASYRVDRPLAVNAFMSRRNTLFNVTSARISLGWDSKKRSHDRKNLLLGICHSGHCIII
jgi:hypothetical protein